MERISRREYDVIIFGLGNIGQSIVNYFLRELPRLSNGGISWALAARSKEKLTAFLDTLFVTQASSIPIDLYTADATDQFSLKKLAERASILINCVGPYERYGKAIIEACIESQTHYIDVSVEPAFILDVIKEFHQIATERGVVILPGCGVTEIFSDVGVLAARYELLPGQISYTDCYLNLDPYELKQIVLTDWYHLTGSTLSYTPRPRQTESRYSRFQYTKFIQKWIMPAFYYSPTEIIVQRTNQLSHSQNSYFNSGHYLAVSSLMDFIYFIVILYFLLIIFRFEKIRNFRYKWAANSNNNSSYDWKPEGSYLQPYSSDDLMAGGAGSSYFSDPFFPTKKGINVIVASVGEVSPYITTSLNDNLQRQIVVQVSGPPNLNHIQTSALTASVCALGLSRLLSYPSSKNKNFRGVLTPVSVFGIDLLTQLEQASVTIQILRSKRLTEPDTAPTFTEENTISHTSTIDDSESNQGFSIFGGIQF